MSQLALNRSGSLSFLAPEFSSASAEGGELLRRIRSALMRHKGGDRAAGVSPSLDALNCIAAEAGLGEQSKIFELAEAFLLALPPSIPVPELTIDSDNDILFDWLGSNGEMLTLALSSEGRLTYAARFSPLDKEHGVKVFVDEIPGRISELIERVSGTC